MKQKLSLIVASALLATTASAMQFQTLGYKSVAMGGAAVANSSGSFATYNNPALLAKPKYDAEFAVGAGISTHDHGVGASVNALEDSGFIDTLEKADNNLASLSSGDINNLLEGKNIIMGMNGNSVELAPQVYVAAQISNFGFGVFGTSDMVAEAVINQAHDQLIFENGGYYGKINADGSVSTSTLSDYTNSSVEYAINNGLTYLDVRAIALAEVPIAYGHKFQTAAGNIMIGAAAKYMYAMTYTEQLKVDNSDYAGQDKLDNKDSSFGVDVGFAYEPSFAKDLTIGFVAKNLNTPKFSFVDGSEVEIEPMLRAGFSYNLLDSLEIAADMDITENKTLINGVKNQMVGGGFSFHPASWFAIRGGVMKNLDANDKADLIYTAGLGFGLKWLQLDLSAQMSQNTTTVSGTEYPQYAKVNLALISRW